MKACYFGTYSKESGYPRNRIIIEGLRQNGMEVIECHINLWGGPWHKLRVVKNTLSKIKFLLRLISTYLLLIIKFFRTKGYDVLIIGYLGHFDIFLAKILNAIRRRPIVFDAFLSLYDTIVNDRKILSPRSIMAKFLWFIDKYSCQIANLVLLDTNEHINYFVKEFGIPKEKFLRVFISADNTIFKPIATEKKDGYFRLLFFGTYIPLHGIEHIIHAAKQLESERNIRFTLVGTGPLYDNTTALINKLGIRNVDLINRWVDYPDIANYIAGADICLGIFGTTEKAKRVVPCKVYECLAMGKAVITGNSPAAREILVDGENAILCEMGNSSAIKEAVLLLKENSTMLNKIGRNAYQLYLNRLAPKVIGKNLREELEKFIKNKNVISTKYPLQ